jgi:hypothetical protein
MKGMNIILLASCVNILLFHPANSFSITNRKTNQQHKLHSTCSTNSKSKCKSYSHQTLNASSSSNHDDEDNTNSNNNERNDKEFEFMKDLQNAKQQLGTPIGYESTEEAETAAENSQNDFLAAMKSVKDEFQDSKEELGADRAIDLIKTQWDMEDQLRDVRDEELDQNGEFE